MEALTMARALRGTYDRTLCAFRPAADGGETAVYVDVPCALSRRAQTSAPETVKEGAALPEVRYALALYTMPDVVLRLNDRVAVRERTGRVYGGRASDSVRYPSHCVTVVEVEEVTAAAAEADALGQSSREDAAAETDGFGQSSREDAAAETDGFGQSSREDAGTETAGGGGA